MIILEDISKEYLQGKTNVKVLNKLFLRVKINENVGIIGPSGSGKSTLLNLIGLSLVHRVNYSAFRKPKETSVYNFLTKNFLFLFIYLV